MTLLLTGATGYIGTAVTARLVDAGHEVVALVRPGSGTARLPAGTRTVPGDVGDVASLRRALAQVEQLDGVVHLSAAGGAHVDLPAAATFADALRDRRGLLLWTSGVWVLGRTAGAAAAEDSPTAPIAIVADRPTVEQRVLAAAADGVRAVVLRPGVVHGRGAGIPALLVDRARTDGVGRHPGEDGVRWPMVHVDDLADLYVAAVERAAAGTVLHGVAEEGVPVRDLAAAAALAVGLPARSERWPDADVVAAVGAPFAEALGLHQVVGSAATRAALGWEPSRPGAVADVAEGSYRVRLTA